MNKCDWADCVKVGLFDGVENTLLNAEGEVVHQQPGLNQSPEFILDALRRSKTPATGPK